MKKYLKYLKILGLIVAVALFSVGVGSLVRSEMKSKDDKIDLVYNYKVAFSDVNNNDEVFQGLVKKYQENPEIALMIFDATREKYNQEAYAQINEAFGIPAEDERYKELDVQISRHESTSPLTYGIVNGISMFRMKDAGDIHVMWQNEIKSGIIGIRLVKADGTEVFSNSDINMSMQTKLSLDAGDYFVIINQKDVVDLKVYLRVSNDIFY